MEKYRLVSDIGTGHNAFVPQWCNSKVSKVESCLTCVVMTPFALVKCVLSVVPIIYMLLAWCVVEAVVRPVTSSSQCWRVRRFVVYWLPCRVLLLLLGFWKIGVNEVEPRRLGVRASTSLRSPQSDTAQTGPGNIIIANFTNLSEVLYLTSTLSPLFVVPHSGGSLSVLTFTEAIRFSLSLSPLSGKGKYTRLSSVVSHLGHRAPLVVWPEGQKTNGTALLSWKWFTSSIDKDPIERQSRSPDLTHLTQRTSLCVFHYPYSTRKSYTPPHTVRSTVSVDGRLHELATPSHIRYRTPSHTKDTNTTSHSLSLSHNHSSLC
eukprot:GHVN01024678.1.p1 GENE.GHVN01024678.1~~GHVN01024678.1.p1  ORF type:complete len:319 (+),score=74.27 GHVN01024678.1:61-1017(+)